MFNIAKILQTPEVEKVYVGSFWGQPLKHLEHAEIFAQDKEKLLQEIHALPDNSLTLKLNQLVRRVRLIKVHSFILAELRRRMPLFYGSAIVQTRLIEELHNIFESVENEYEIAAGDLPEIAAYRMSLVRLVHHHGPNCFARFANLTQAEVRVLDDLLQKALPALQSKNAEDIDLIFDAMEASMEPRYLGIASVSLCVGAIAMTCVATYFGGAGFARLTKFRLQAPSPSEVLGALRVDAPLHGCVQ
eukprot:SAG31_NODE_2045_length_6576_cov_3.774587_1_plen_246_part_00